MIGFCLFFKMSEFIQNRCEGFELRESLGDDLRPCPRSGPLADSLPIGPTLRRGEQGTAFRLSTAVDLHGLCAVDLEGTCVSNTTSEPAPMQ